MKRSLKFIIACCAFVFVLYACDKPVYKYNQDFEGTWRTIPVYDSLLQYVTTSELIINGEDGSYKNSCNSCGADLCSCLNTQVGKAVMNSDKTQMKIGSHGYALTINEEPAVDANGDWTIKIQGATFHKQ